MAGSDRFDAEGDSDEHDSAPAIVPEVVRLLRANGYVLFQPGEYPAPAILVVDDRLKTADMMVKLLRSDGYAARAADGCESARAVGLGQRFDLLLTNLEMADGDGCDLLRAMRDLHGSDGIALTACEEDEEVRRSRAAGFLYHLTKPVVWGRLTAAVEGAMTIRRRRVRS